MMHNDIYNYVKQIDKNQLSNEELDEVIICLKAIIYRGNKIYHFDNESQAIALQKDVSLLQGIVNKLEKQKELKIKIHESLK